MTREVRLALAAGDYARVTVDQTGLDVAVRLLDPAGGLLAEVDGPGGRKEPELLSWIAAAAGDFRLEITAHTPGEAGHCKAILEERRPSGPRDAERVEMDRISWEADHLLALEDVESKRGARDRYEKALAFWEAIGDRRNQVSALNRLGAIHRVAGETGEAVALYERAITLALEVGDVAGEATAHNNLGVARNQLGQSRKALEDFQEALRLWESLGSSNEIATTSYGLGVVQFALGDNDEALRSLNRALEIQRAANDLSTQPLILAAIASIFRERGNGDVALELYQQGLEISRSMKDRNGEGTVLQNMAAIYLRRGELQRALEGFTAALDIHRQLGNKPEVGWLLSFLGATSLYLGDTDQALDFYSRALDIHREMGSAIWEAYTLCDIGWIHDVRNEPQVALDYYARAFEISRGTGDRRSQGLALQGMGRIEVALGSPAEAVRMLEEAINIYREIGNALGEINAVLELGHAYQALSDNGLAAETLHRAVELSRQHKTLMTEAVAQSAVARLERDRGNLDEAAAAIEDAVSIIESIRPKVAAQRQRVTFFASRRDYYDFYVDLQMRLYERDPTGGHLAAALSASERARARGLLDLLAEGRIDLRKGISPELKQKEDEVGNRISLLQSALLEDLSQGGQKASRLETELDQAEEENERIEWQIQRDHPHYAAVRNPAPLPPERIQAMLDDRTAFLEYAVGKESSFLFVVTREGMQGYRLPPAAELAEDVESVREAIKEPGRRQFDRYTETAYRLYRTLLAPAEAALRDKPHLILSPDGPLLLLSFEALLTAPAAGEIRYGELAYLIREKSVAYVPSASVLAELGGPTDSGAATSASGPGLFVGFADPSYRPASASAPQTEAATGSLARTFQGAGLLSPQPLPSSRDEVTEIASLYPPGQSHLYLGRDASEENVKANPVLRQARWIHFAVHGFLNEEKPELSGLVLSPDDHQRDDGLLQVYEIFNLELPADLVVLSGCDTALGKNVSGEGLLGMSRAFLYAGAASVVVSLWQVADASTADLMVRFYRHLNEAEDKAEALRLSKLELLREDGYDHPYYWAPLILIGRPGPTVTSRQLARQ